MNDLDRLVEEYFKPSKKEPAFNIQSLLEMVEQALDSAPSLSEASAATASEITEKTKKTILDLLPKFEISEAWGQEDTQAREQFSLYMDNVKGNTISQKLAYIRAFMARYNPSKYQTEEILSNLMFLDLLSTVVNNFSPSGSGFLFEAFMAGLLQGTQAVDQVGGMLPIEDFINAEGQPFSLKLLVPGTQIKGSIRNLIQYLAEHKQGADGIEYLTVYKYGKGDVKVLSFYSFTIDHTNIYYWLSDSLEGFGAIKLKEGRVGALSARSVEKHRKEQGRLLPFLDAAIGRRFGAVKALELMASEDGLRGAAALKRYALEQQVASPEEIESFIALSPDDLAALDSGDLKAVRNARRDIRKRIQKVVPPSHPMGSVLQKVEFEDETAAPDSIESLINLYVDERAGGPKAEEWQRQMLTLAGLPIKDDLVQEGKGSTQFEIKSDYVTKRSLPEIYKKVRYGDIDVDRSKITKVAELYAKELKTSVMAVLEQLEILISGLTGYFVGKAEDRGAAATSAINSSTALADLLAPPDEESLP